MNKIPGHLDLPSLSTPASSTSKTHRPYFNKYTENVFFCCSKFPMADKLKWTLSHADYSLYLNVKERSFHRKRPTDLEN